MEWVGPYGESIGKQYTNKISLVFTLERTFNGTYTCRLRDTNPKYLSLPPINFTVEVHCKFTWLLRKSLNAESLIFSSIYVL